MPSNSTQRRSGSGKRPQRGSSGQSPAPKTPASPAPNSPADESAEAIVSTDPATTDTASADVTSADTIGPDAAEGASDAAEGASAEQVGTASPPKAGPGAPETGPGAAEAGAAKAAGAQVGAAKAAGAKAAGAKAAPAKASPAKSVAGKTGTAAKTAGRAAKTTAGAAKTTAKAGAAKAGAKTAPGRGGSGGGKGPTGNRPAGKGGGGRGRQPVKVKSSGLPWGNIVLGGIVAIVALSIIGYGVWYSWDASKPFGERRSQQIDGVTNYRAKDVKWLTQNHVAGKLKYETSPPVGGNHNGSWENCNGDVYAKQIPNEHAVHALEHGAVWVTYNPDLPQAQIDELAGKVKGKDYMLMSPYPGLDKPISLQAWGFQLKVDNANDKRIDEFITQYRVNASVESGASCSNGVTVTGDTPQEAGATDGMKTGG
jgi:hypothetical protein